jgi:ABC-2 type transport system ATP-binding protein
MNVEAIGAVGLVKVYHSKQTVEALKDISLSIDRGELFTLLGQNGAGKTTFLKIISTQLLPTKGDIHVLGYDVVEQPKEVRKHIAIVPQDVATYGNFTPWEYCYYFSKLRGLSKHEADEASGRALKAVGLSDLRNRPCATLSGGEKKRAIIASALSSDADIFMLDEPTSGLDAVARRNVWAVLREMVSNGKTVVLTTHIMEEAEMVSDRVAIIHKGLMVAQGTPDQIRRLISDRYRIVIEGNLENLRLTEDQNHTVTFGNRHIVYVKNEGEALQLVEKALRKGLAAEAARVTLEDTFVRLVGGELD